MIKVIAYVIGLALLVAAAVWFADEPGSVSLNWHGWRVDTSVAVLIAIVAALLVVGTLLLRLWGKAMRAGRAFQDARKEKKLGRGLEALAAGFAAALGGDGSGTAKAVRDAESALGDSPAVRLLRQLAARQRGDDAAASAAARDMLGDPTTELAALKDLSDAALTAGDKQAALDHARRAVGHKPAPAWALTRCLDMEIALDRVAEAAETVSRKDMLALVPTDKQAKLKAEIFTRASVTALANHDPGAAVKWARKALSEQPAHSAASVARARAQAAEGKGRKAATELEKAWAAAPDRTLLTAYLELAPGEAPLQRAARVEKLVAGAPDHAESRLALAEAAIAAELWGQARNRLEPLIDGNASEAQRLLAARRMAEVELGENGDAEAAGEWLSKALTKAAPEDHKTKAKPQSAADLMKA